MVGVRHETFVEVVLVIGDHEGLPRNALGAAVSGFGGNDAVEDVNEVLN